MNSEEKVLQIPIDKIVPNRFQPRITFDDNALQELAQSIKEHGIIQPLVLRNLGDNYEIIAGERRFKAAQMAGLKTVPAIISDIDDKKSAEVALVENIQRKNLTSIEEAKSYKNILDQGYLTQEQLAEKLGISQATVANKLRLLNLADEVQDALLKEKISERHARSLLAIKDKDEQVKWLNRILNERLTVRQLDIEIKKLQKNDTNDDSEDIPLVDLNPNIDAIKENASDINPVQGLHDVEKMLQPSENIETLQPQEQVQTQEESETLQEQQTTEEPVETLDFNDDDDSDGTNVLKPVNDNKIPNKFFNFLEDEGVNMNDGNSLDDLIPNNTGIIENTPVDNSNFNIDNDQFLNIVEENNDSKSDVVDDNNPINNSLNNVDNSINNDLLSNSVNSDNSINNVDLESNNNLVDNDLNNSIIDLSNNIEENQTVENPTFTNEIVDNTINEPIDNIINVNPNSGTEQTDFNNNEINNSLLNNEGEAPRTNKFFNFDFANEENNEEKVEQNNEGIVPTDNNLVDNTIYSDNSGDTNNSDTIIYDTSIDQTFDKNDANNYIIEEPTESDDSSNNVIEIEQENKDDDLFDPMSMVSTLEDNYEEKLEEETGTDLKTAINSFREIRDDLENKGFNITLDEADLGDSYTITINIIK